MLKSKTEIGLAVENHQGVRSHREWGKFGLSYLSFFKMPVRPRCLHQILTACQTNHFVVHYNCSCLCIMQRWGVSVCQFFRNQSQTTLRSWEQAETHQINHNWLMDELMDSSWYWGWLLRNLTKTLLIDPQASNASVQIRKRCHESVKLKWLLSALHSIMWYNSVRHSWHVVLALWQLGDVLIQINYNTRMIKHLYISHTAHSYQYQGQSSSHDNMLQIHIMFSLCKLELSHLGKDGYHWCRWAQMWAARCFEAEGHWIHWPQ